jgi:hypothetical protein
MSEETQARVIRQEGRKEDSKEMRTAEQRSINRGKISGLRAILTLASSIALLTSGVSKLNNARIEMRDYQRQGIEVSYRDYMQDFAYTGLLCLLGASGIYLLNTGLRNLENRA